MDAIKSRCSRRKSDGIHYGTLENFLEKPDTHKANISKKLEALFALDMREKTNASSI